MKKIFFVVIIFALILGCNQKKDDTIKVGVILPLTGDLANFGKTVLDGIKLGFDDNDNKNIVVKLIIEDSKAKPKDAVNSFNKLISIDEVNCVIGALTSGSTLAITPEANKNKTFLISPTASSPLLSDAGPYFYRVYPSDLFDAEIASNYCFNNLSSPNASIVYLNNDYCNGLKEVFLNNYKKLGGKVQSAIAFNENISDFKSIISRLKTENNNVIYIIGHPVGIGMFLRQSKELGFNVNFFSNVAAEDREFYNVAGSSSNGLLFTAPAFDLSSKEPYARNFIKKFENKYGYVPDIHAVKGYDISQILLQCFKNGKIHSSEIKSFIDSTKVFRSVNGFYKFKNNGDIVEPVAIKKYVNDSIKIIEIIKP